MIYLTQEEQVFKDTYNEFKDKFKSIDCKSLSIEDKYKIQNDFCKRMSIRFDNFSVNTLSIVLESFSTNLNALFHADLIEFPEDDILELIKDFFEKYLCSPEFNEFTANLDTESNILDDNEPKKRIKYYKKTCSINSYFWVPKKI